MDIQALKLKLVEKILHTEKTSLLVKLDDLLKDEGEKEDWWEQLPTEVQQVILEGLKDVDEGNVLTHEEVLQEAKQRYGF